MDEIRSVPLGGDGGVINSLIASETTANCSSYFLQGFDLASEVPIGIH
jgi:hypothetical protein